jgi:membrane dipeptidase
MAFKVSALKLPANHLGRTGFFDALDASDGPIIVSHSGAFSVHKSSRAIDDDQIKAIADRKGLVRIIAIARQYAHSNAALENVVDHIEYTINLVGIDFVGLGMDSPSMMARGRFRTGQPLFCKILVRLTG